MANIFERMVVGIPKRDEPDWDPTIHAECDAPAENCTGGRVTTMREWMLTHDRGMGVPEDKPSAWKIIDVIPALVVSVMLVIVLLGLIAVVLGALAY